ncbi:transposable element Tcb1 transposase [Trichonephila clavipes]|nr:transposable element Tcb1 transposase [Trichonephila clavipes]
MSRRKQRSAFDQVSEFDRGRIVAYRDCGLSFRQIGTRVGRKQATHSSSTHCRYFKQPALHLRGVEPVVLPYLQDLTTAIFQQDNARPHDFPKITPPAATQDQLWQRVEAAWSAVPQEHIQSLFESMPKRVAAVISNNGSYSGY